MNVHECWSKRMNFRSQKAIGSEIVSLNFLGRINWYEMGELFAALMKTDGGKARMFLLNWRYMTFVGILSVRTEQLTTYN